MRYSVIFLFCFIISCSPKKDNEIHLYNEIYFKINEGEAIGVADSKTRDIYTENFNNGPVQIPLFKYINHKDYDIFIGLPFNTSLDALIQNQPAKLDSLISNQESDTLSYYIAYKRNGLYITEYAVKLTGSSLVFISTISRSKEITDSLFNKFGLSTRINTNNNESRTR